MLAYVVWYLGVGLFAVGAVGFVVMLAANVLGYQAAEEQAKVVSVVAWVALSLEIVSGMFVWALLNPFKW